MSISLKRLIGRTEAGDAVAVLIFAVLVVIGIMLIADGLRLKVHEREGFVSPAHMLVDVRLRPHG
jgi:hypothetical protein